MRFFVLMASVTGLLAAPPVPRTMRVDYYHTGDSASEVFALDEVVVEGAWPGRLDRSIDDTNLGK